MWELQNTEAAASGKLMGAETAQDAARIYSESFLRPGVPHMDRRLAETANLVEQATKADASSNQTAMLAELLQNPNVDANVKKLAISQMTTGQTQFRPATAEEASEYGAKAGQFDNKSGRFYPINPPKGMSIEMGPDGKVRIIEGAGVTQGETPDLNVEQGKTTGFYNRMLSSEDVLGDLEQEGTDFMQTIVGQIPLAGNFLMTPKYQQYSQAKRDFINAQLRRESGAVISEQEFANAEQQYFPQPGDSAEVIDQKRANRRTAIDGIRVATGDGGDFIDQKRKKQTEADKAGRSVIAPTPENIANMTVEQFEALDNSGVELTDAELDLIIQRLEQLGVDY